MIQQKLSQKNRAIIAQELLLKDVPSNGLVEILDKEVLDKLSTDFDKTQLYNSIIEINDEMRKVETFQNFSAMMECKKFYIEQRNLMKKELKKVLSEVDEKIHRFMLEGNSSEEEVLHILKNTQPQKLVKRIEDLDAEIACLENLFETSMKKFNHNLHKRIVGFCSNKLLIAYEEYK